jgi:predicted Zn-dependent protease
VGSLEAGCELLDACGPPRFDLAGDSFALPVRGFEVSGGERRRPVARALLSGTIRDLLGGLRAVAGDLTFVRHPAGLIGSPTVRLSGLTLGPARGT